METHVKVLGMLHIILGFLGALGAVTVLAIFGGIAGIVGASAQAEPDARLAIPILGAIGGVIAVFILLISLPGIIAGFGLLNYRPWARILTIILSAINLLNIPIGTALGVYGLWVLLSPVTERLFAVPQVRHV
jgi:hypothetical protein